MEGIDIAAGLEVEREAEGEVQGRTRAGGSRAAEVHNQVGIWGILETLRSDARDGRG